MVNFPYINRIELQLSNWKDFIYRVNLRTFLRNLKSNPPTVDWNDATRKPDLKNKITLIMDGRTSRYDFDNEDFCRFVDFPFDSQLIRPLIWTREKKCTCLIKWLGQNDKHYPADNEYGMSTNSVCDTLNCTSTDLDKTKCLSQLSRQQRLAAESASTKLSPVVIALIACACVLVVVFVIGIVYIRFKSSQSNTCQGGIGQARRRGSKMSDTLEMSAANFETSGEQEVLNLDTIVRKSFKNESTPEKKLIKKSKFRKSEH